MTLAIDFSEPGVREGSSPSLTMQKKGSIGTRKLLINWSDLPSAFPQILGYSEVIRTNGTPYLSRQLPELHPYMQIYPATKVEVERGVKWLNGTSGANGDSNGYNEALLNIEYSDVDYIILDDATMAENGYTELYRYVSYREETSADYLSIPQGGVYWANNAPTGFAPPEYTGTVPFGVGRIQAYKELHFIWHEIPYDGIPTSTIEATIGHVNKTAFQVGSASYPAGTLLCEAPRVDLYTQANGQYGWEIEYIFRYNPNLWNNLFLNNPKGTSGYFQVNRTSTGAYYPPGSVPNSQCIYDEIEFANLFLVV